MTQFRPDIHSEADVQRLVDTFYQKVNQDELLDPVFNGFAHVDWQRHLPIMYDFWSSLLLGTSRYAGRPFPKHIPLPVDATHFTRWMQLFEATVDELFAGPVADIAKERAVNIATMFEYRLRKRNPLSLL
ncbi:group III truncated hemoglobin [Hymenobacter cellulosivorans]|uniref:Group III truncated hemoglobin n=1 Tax=Hymenobacter cellulosivorans TaxID=2932249 RepID=A0ABY4F3K8_9BACT|nr:group III truncated hemoglobin [Hymenobacter cellulosivorans]UOQ51150.1 group III truncated hemoglobin [Hymenobacter cellulosivorans]